jgi:hypothetical protein
MWANATCGPITGNAIGLDTVWYRLRQAKSHPPDLGYQHPTEVAVQPLDVLRFHPDLPKPFVHNGFAPFRSAVHTCKELLPGLGEIPQRLLLHRLTPGTKPRILGTRLRQLRALPDIAGSPAARLRMPLLFHRQIPHVPRIATVRQQDILLPVVGNSRNRDITSTVTTNTDIRGRPAHPSGPTSSPH